MSRTHFKQSVGELLIPQFLQVKVLNPWTCTLSKMPSAFTTNASLQPVRQAKNKDGTIIRSITALNYQHQWKMNLLCLSQAHRPSMYGKRRWHHHQRHRHKMCSHLGLHRWDRMMHPKSEELFSSQVLSEGLKNLNPGREVTSVVIHIYFLALYEFFSL